MPLFFIKDMLCRNIDGTTLQWLCVISCGRLDSQRDTSENLKRIAEPSFVLEISWTPVTSHLANKGILFFTKRKNRGGRFATSFPGLICKTQVLGTPERVS